MAKLAWHNTNNMKSTHITAATVVLKIVILQT